MPINDTIVTQNPDTIEEYETTKETRAQNRAEDSTNYNVLKTHSANIASSYLMQKCRFRAKKYRLTQYRETHRIWQS